VRAPDLGVTTRSPQALDAIHRFGGELLSHGCHAAVIFEGVIADPECALAHAYAATLFLCLSTRAGQVQAAPHIAAARALDASPRESAIVAAVSAWGAGDEAHAAQGFAGVVDRWPHDLVAAKLAQILQLASGDARAMVRTASTAAAADPGGHALGLLAFALDQNGETDRAEALARRAIDRDPVSDPWAQHAMAHVHSAREDWAAGRAFLRAHAPSWDRCSSFMLTHNWWHAALFSLRLGDVDGALDLYDTRVWGVRKGHCQDQLNAVSLLSRLEIAGADGGARWADVADHAALNAAQVVSGFAELHYLYALARAGRDTEADAVAAMLGEIRARDPDNPAGDLAIGLLLHARRQFYPAALALGQSRRRHARVGGSQVQRQWFDELLVDSLARSRVEGGARACA
jgi:tetratricopeptide (TPR) repeat protein